MRAQRATLGSASIFAAPRPHARTCDQLCYQFGERDRHDPPIFVLVLVGVREQNARPLKIRQIHRSQRDVGVAADVVEVLRAVTIIHCYLVCALSERDVDLHAKVVR